MTTLILSHEQCLGHIAEAKHPERADRLRAIDRVLQHEVFSGLRREEAPLAQIADIGRVHSLAYVEWIRRKCPREGVVNIDQQGDTIMSPPSWDAALRAAGAAAEAVDQVMTGRVQNVFCAVRPPGHHAEPERAMGFCIFNNAAVAAVRARVVHRVERVAVVDFDVHHGNGTQSMFWSDKGLFYASSHQDRFYPYTGDADETGVANNIVNVPLKAGAGGELFREAYRSVILPALDNFAPDLLIISAGFDGHRDDPLGELMLEESDYRWVTEQLAKIAAVRAGGRIVSVLEGGYNLKALAGSVGAHVLALMEAGA
jgi:acetoin utilization deacetylase AcuC-like enzyme